VSNEDTNEEIFSKIENVFGSVDVVMSSTGGLWSPCDPNKITDEMLDDKLHHQVTETYNMVRAALPYLKKSKAGRVIFVSSGGALDGFDGENIVDSIARGGVISMTYALARALAEDGITVNCIARSGMINDHPPKGSEDLDAATLQSRIPVGKCGTGTEFGAMAAYIASEESAFVTGHVFNLTGGLHIG